jgi:hypothetical protein
MSDEYGLETPFWIDTEGYSDRDRALFVCGVEFQMVCEQLESGEPIDRPIHTENASRIRLLCGRRKRACEIEPHADYEGCETWSQFRVAGAMG